MMKKKLLTLSLLFVLSGCGTSNAVTRSFVYALPQSDVVEKLSVSTVSRTALPALTDVSAAFANNSGNLSLCPASYLLAVAGLSSVSASFPDASFGLEAGDVRQLLSAWNFDYEVPADKDGPYGTHGEERSLFQSAVAFQQVGETYRFDEEKRLALTEQYVSTMVSSLPDYYQDAEAFFHDELGFTVDVPNPHLSSDGVIAYGAFKMKDCVPGGLAYAKKEYRGKQVDAHTFGSIYYPKLVEYYPGDNYEAFALSIRATSLLIVLPHEDASIDEVDVAEAYRSFHEHKRYVEAVGYVPFFHIASSNVDLTSPLASKMTGKERFYDKLLQDGVKNDLCISYVLQSNDYEFNRFGVSGESITAIIAVGSSAPEEHQVVELNVNRPFYALSCKDGFPLFANRIIDL